MATLIAILLIPLLGMAAFAVDMGYIVRVRIELGNAADAAALAGVQQLYTPYWTWAKNTNLLTKASQGSSAVALAKATAKAVALANKAGNVSIQLLDSEVDVGYTSAAGVYTSSTSLNMALFFPNTVKITARRDNTSTPSTNGEVGLFFGPVLGKSSVAVTATATAAAYDASLTNFKTGAGNGGMLPIAVDMTRWFDFFYNGSASQYADDNSPSGTAWFQIYPGGQGESMRGLLSLNGSKAASETYYGGSTAWIQSGATSSDIASLQSAGDLPLSGSQHTWASGPGMKSTLISDFQTLVTTPATVKLLPVYDPNSAGTTGGGNGTYDIRYIVPVYVVYAQGHGSNMDIAVIPAGNPILDSNLSFNNSSPLGSNTSVNAAYRTAISAKLTQ